MPGLLPLGTETGGLKIRVYGFKHGIWSVIWGLKFIVERFACVCGRYIIVVHNLPKNTPMQS